MASGLVVVPALDEAPRIGDVLRGVRESAPDFDVLVVDDGSSDATAEVARKAGARVVSLSFHLGYGAALQTGYRFALRRGCEVVVQLDADGQHDPAAVHALAAPVLEGDLDVVVGSRFHADSRYRMPAMRRLGSRWFRWLLRALTGLDVSDPTSGLQALSPRALRLYTSEAFPWDYPDADVLVLAHRAGCRVGELPVRMFERAGAPSMHGALTAPYYIYRMTLAMCMNRLRAPAR